MYNCKKCPGYCCTYPLIALDKRDVAAAGQAFRPDLRAGQAQFTVERWGHKYSMRRKADKIFGMACRFFDTEKRCCTVYEARPSLCRSFRAGAAATTTSWRSSARRRKTPSSSPPPTTSNRPRSSAACEIACAWRSPTADSVIATSAANVSAAFTACEYSHCRRAASKFSGIRVQFWRRSSDR